MADTPHIVCIPFPIQSHIGAMMKLAKLLHGRGFYITFVNTEHNHNCILRARGLHSLDGKPDFNFKTIPDGLPPSDANGHRDGRPLVASLQKMGPTPFINLLQNLEETNGIPPVTSIISDGFMPFTVPQPQSLKIPVIRFWTVSACSLMGYHQFPALVQKGLTPLKDESYLMNGYLDTVIDWIPGMKNIRLKDLPSNIRITDPNAIGFYFPMESIRTSADVSAHIIHTFYDLESDVLDALSQILPDLHAIGPLQLLASQETPRQESVSNSIGFNMWKEESECIGWLDSKQPGSVIYVNLGSIVHITSQQLAEIGWGLANSGCKFLLIVRSDLVIGESAVLSPEFQEEIKERGLIASWCPQEQVLNHPSVGGFLTHCGWNSTIESLSAGVAMICWPFVADQPTNCKYICSDWKAGLEMEGNRVNREEVEKLVRELMGGNEGMKIKKKAMEWKKMAEEAAATPDGSSCLAFDKLVKKLELLAHA